jgi:RNA polymerase sigma-70 factor (ECF subfamily)
MRSLPGYRGDAPVVAWLGSIARRVCADDVRSRQRRRRLRERLISNVDDRVTSSSAGDASTAAVHDVLATLDPDRREAFLLTQFAGLSYDEAATVIGCPIGTVRSRVARARADLVTALAADEAMHGRRRQIG